MEPLEAYRIIAPPRAEDPEHTARMQEAMRVLFGLLSELAVPLGRKFKLDDDRRDDAVSGVLLGLIRATTDRKLPPDARVLRAWLYKRLEWYVLGVLEKDQDARKRHSSLNTSSVAMDEAVAEPAMGVLNRRDRTAEGAVLYGIAVLDNEAALVERQLIERFFDVIAPRIAATKRRDRQAHFLRSIPLMRDVYSERLTWEAVVEAEGAARNTLQQRFSRTRRDILVWLREQGDLPSEEREAYRNIVEWLLRERQ